MIESAILFSVFEPMAAIRSCGGNRELAYWILGI